jgi:Ca-activated chloride channel homolog
VQIAWNGLPVSEVFPARVPDLFAAKPLVITGKYTGAARGTVRLTGTIAGKPFARDIRVDFPAAEAKHDVLAKLWARTKVDHLTHESGTKQEITQLGLAYKLMTQYTSFVAVEDKVVNEGGKSRRVEVPVEMPEGVRHDSVFGAEIMASARVNGIAQLQMSVAATPAFLPRTEPSPKPALTSDVRASAKLHPSLAGLTETRKVDVLIWVTARSEDNLAALKQLGVELVSSTMAHGRLYVGRIEANKLAELARLAFVTYIAPVK